MNRVAIVITTYNSEKYIQKLLTSINDQERDDLYIIFSDDGSSDETVKKLQFFKEQYKKCTVLALEHGERGIARAKAMEIAIEMNLDYLMFLDSDMSMETDLIDECIDVMDKENMIGALVLKELPVSGYDNLMTRIKIFERMVLNNSSRILDKNSIEAARFWRTSAYLESGGINPLQIAFEETQPTIRFIEEGGLIVKHIGRGVYHDEKKVTLKNILTKKKYHFSVMNKTIETEDNGLLKTLKRWYFFRPVMYKKSNLKMYVKHPLLTLGMISMYMTLTFIGCFELIKQRLLS